MSKEKNDIKEKKSKKKSGDVKRRNKGEGSIRKKGNSYEGRVTIEIDGIKKQVSVSDRDKRVVIQKMAQIKNESENNSYILSNNITVEEWLKKWVNTYKRGVVNNNTLSSYIISITKYIAPEIGNYELQKIQPIHIQQILTKMKNGQCKTTKKQLAPKTIKDTYCVLNMAFEAAIKNNLLKSNCVQKVDPPKLRVKEPEIMTREEQRKFENLLAHKYEFAVYLFLLKTGERASEAAGSDWDDIDFKNRIVIVRNGLVSTALFTEELKREKNTVEESDLKTESSVRKIPMLFGAYELLKEYREEYMKVNNIKTIAELKGKPLFLTSKGNRIKADFLWTKLSRYLKKVEFRHIGVHQLRHTFATRCLEAGISVKYLQKLLGHSTSRMTDRYTHLLIEFEKEENKKIEEFYKNNILKEEKKTPIIYKGKIKGKIKIIRKIA